MVFAEMRDIETERLILRKFETNDAPEVYRNYASNDNVTRFLTWPTHTSAKASYDYINNVLESYKNGRYYEWAIVFKEIGEVIGAISIVRMREKKNDVEIGLLYRRNFRASGHHK